MSASMAKDEYDVDLVLWLVLWLAGRRLKP